jgi:GT2 family glycosyltransferase
MGFKDLAGKAVSTPLIDIIMLVHDQAPWVLMAIQAIDAFTANPYRLILVDSGSVEEDTKDVLDDAEDNGHTVLRLKENKSFSAGVNAGIAIGSSKFIAIVNSDVIVMEGWDTALIGDASAKHVGLVGAQSNNVTGPQGDPGFIGKPPFLCFTCVCLKRSVWEAVGPLDEVTFDGFSTEDIDYSWRVVKAGLELKVSSAVVLHGGSRTLAATVGDAAARELINKKYNGRLVEKWGKEWSAEHAKLAKRVLVATYHAEEWTRVSFMGAFAGLKRSDGVTFSYHHMTRAPIHMARQLLCDYALDQKFDYLVQIDDDAIFPPDLIRRLLSHDKDVVCALAYQRKPPHGICAFEVGDDGLMGKPLEGIEHTGLRKADVSGYHCSILKTSVIQKLRDAGIKQYFGGFENKVGEDFAFSLNLKKTGIQLYVDTDLIAGHIGESIVVDEDYKKRNGFK